MKFWSAFVSVLVFIHLAQAKAPDALVLQTDFGTKDGAVAAMRGVAFGISREVPIFDLSHENTPFDIWEAAYRLDQAAPYWPAGTVFVSVIDPGVGTEREAVVLRTKSGHLFVGPDNGSWTLVAERLGVDGVRQIDAARHQRAGSSESYTFHGRDLFVVMGAKLAAGAARFEDVGPDRKGEVVRLAYEKARREEGALVGNIPSLDFQYGNVWSNIPGKLVEELGLAYGQRARVTLSHEGRVVFSDDLPYVRTFGDVPVGAPLLYLNSVMNLAVALNQGNFAEAHQIASGGAWNIRVEKAK